MPSYNTIVVINVAGVVVRYMASPRSTVKDAVDYAIRSLLGEGKNSQTFKCQVSHQGKKVPLECDVSLIHFNVGDMLNVEFIG